MSSPPLVRSAASRRAAAAVRFLHLGIPVRSDTTDRRFCGVMSDAVEQV